MSSIEACTGTRTLAMHISRMLVRYARREIFARAGACIWKLDVIFCLKHTDFVQRVKCVLCGNRSMTSPAFHLTCLPVSACRNVMASFNISL
jgi:hypothetical protein